MSITCLLQITACSAFPSTEIPTAVSQPASETPDQFAAFLVNEKDQAWVDSLCVPQPIGTMTEKLKLTGARERIGKKAYIRAAAYPNPGFDKAYARVKADRAWRSFEVPGGHDVMVDMPQRLAEILLEVA
jgi:hypothetical protein